MIRSEFVRASTVSLASPLFWPGLAPWGPAAAAWLDVWLAADSSMIGCTSLASAYSS